MGFEPTRKISHASESIQFIPVDLESIHPTKNTINEMFWLVRQDTPSFDNMVLVNERMQSKNARNSFL